MKILISRSPFSDFTPSQIARIKATSRSHHFVDCAVSDSETYKRQVADAEIVFGLLQPATIDFGDALRWAHSVGTAIDDIVDTLSRRRSQGIVVTGERGARPYLAEHAFALLLAITRGIHTAIRNPVPGMRMQIRDRQWELTNKSICILGFGTAGRAIARRARGFELNRIIAVDPNGSDDESLLDGLYPPHPSTNALASRTSWSSVPR